MYYVSLNLRLEFVLWYPTCLTMTCTVRVWYGVHGMYSWSCVSLVCVRNSGWAMRCISEILSIRVAASFHHYQKYLYTQLWWVHRAAGCSTMCSYTYSRRSISQQKSMRFSSMLWWSNLSFDLNADVNSYARGVVCGWVIENHGPLWVMR